MKQIQINQSAGLIGTIIALSGFVVHIRHKNKIHFIVLGDSTGQIQITYFSEDHESEIVKILLSLTIGSTITVVGKIQSNSAVKLNGIEMILSSITLHAIAAPYPIDEQSDEHRRLDYRFLDLRTQQNTLIFQIQTAVERLMREFWYSNKFIEIHSPKLMSTPSESGAELFEVKYFEGKAFLAQSPQFYKQMGMSAGFDRVFEIGPVFRANPSFTSRHDTEFTSVDVEMAWINSHEDIMCLEEQWLEYVLIGIKKEFNELILKHFGVCLTVPLLPFPRITHADAVQILINAGYESQRDGDLDTQGEKILAKYVMEKFGHEFVFVTDYPVKVRPFYHMRHEGSTTLTKSFDLIWKGLEVTTGAQREHRYDILTQQVLEKGLSVELLSHYLEFFKYGCPPHGGFGFGLTRMLMNLLDLPNVRQATYLYRGPKRLTP